MQTLRVWQCLGADISLQESNLGRQSTTLKLGRTSLRPWRACQMYSSHSSLFEPPSPPPPFTSAPSSSFGAYNCGSKAGQRAEITRTPAEGPRMEGRLPRAGHDLVAFQLEPAFALLNPTAVSFLRFHPHTPCSAHTHSPYVDPSARHALRPAALSTGMGKECVQHPMPSWKDSNADAGKG